MSNRTVLIIEDEEPLQEIYSKILNDAGIDTLVASTGEEGLTLALENHPDVLLVDVMLPDTDGHDVVRKLRHDKWGKTATVIFLTNRTDAESIFKAVEHGGDEYIIKAHVTNAELLNKVRGSMVT